MSLEPWSADQIMALAPDAPSQRAGRGLATTGPWQGLGRTADPPALWGLCKGSGAKPYQACVDLTEPAYRCSCPSRKFPCKHSLGLMLLWSAGSVPAGDPPDWVTEWQAGRAQRKEAAAVRAEAAPRAPRRTDAARTDPAKAAQRRAGRVDAGIEELDRWLSDQVRQGLAGASRAGYAHWDAMAARLVDAQAPGLASAVRRLASVSSAPEQLLTELSLIQLLVTGYRRLPDLPEGLAATVRSRVGFPVATEDVLAGPRVRDTWAVAGVRDEIDERLSVRRFWLRGSAGQPALVLSFAPPGQPLASDLLLGTALDADLCFYPGAQPLRALVAERHGAATPVIDPPGATPIAAALDGYARALAAEPWLERWPMLLAGVVPARDDAGRWHLRDGAGDALPLDASMETPWRLVAAAGGAPVTIAAEWTSAGLRPLTVWIDGRMARP